MGFIFFPDVLVINLYLFPQVITPLSVLKCSQYPVWKGELASKLVVGHLSVACVYFGWLYVAVEVNSVIFMCVQNHTQYMHM